MTLPNKSESIAQQDSEIAATVLRERKKLGNFILRQVIDAGEAEDILQDVFYELVQTYQLLAPIEQVSAWLYRVARNRIVDRFRKKKEQSIDDFYDDDADVDSDYRLDLILPAPNQGPETEYARTVLLKALHEALDALPDNQREVFIAHELDGISFKELALQSGVALNTLLARKRYAVLFLRERLQTIYDEFEL
jgi:RNA polymerase sigma factor (sigma-70 family)